MEQNFGILPKICIIVLNTSKWMRYLSWEDRKMRNVCFKKALVVGIVVLFIGVTISPTINANINITSNKIFNTFKSNKGFVPIKCQFFTISGIQEVEKEVSFEDFDYLSNLIDKSDYNAIASKLYSLNLLPESMSADDVEDLISGEYGKREFKEYQNKLKELSIKDSSGETIRNVFCAVKGEGRDSGYFALWALASIGISIPLITIDEILLKLFPNYPVLTQFFFADIGFFGVIGLFLLILALMWPYIGPPVKLNACLAAWLQDGPKEVMPYVNTLGLLGEKTIEGWSLSLLMIGFLGILIYFIWDTMNEPGSKFMGFSLYTRAKK